MSHKIIVCNTEKCTGCRICEYICSSVNEGVINPRTSRIKTIRIDPVFDLALSCRKCEKPKCINSCARNAISQDETTRQIVISKEKCDGCGYCIKDCPYGVLTLGIDKKIASVCDSCTEKNVGIPACVDYCPTGAIKYLSIDEIEEKAVKDFHSTLQEKSKE
ncbi:MAG: 4Fe-4S dicluster domain-containing protein [archaeon]